MKLGLILPAIFVTHCKQKTCEHVMTPSCKKQMAPTPTYFAMYMRIKDLQRSVGDRYENERLTGSLPKY